MLYRNLTIIEISKVFMKNSIWPLAFLVVAPASLLANQTTLEKTLAPAHKQWGASVGLSALGLKGDKQSAQVSAAFAEFWGLYKSASWLSFRVRAGAQFEVGGHEALFTDEFAPENTLYLEEGYAQATWGETWRASLKLGAVNQRSSGNPFLVTDVAFPAAVQSLAWTEGRWAVELSAQQALANHYQRSARLGSVKEGTPQFWQEKLQVQWENHRNQVKVHAGHFTFKNLSSDVAYQSQFMGNTVFAESPENAGFAYGFGGAFAGAEWKGLATRAQSLGLKANYLFNDRAADGSNTAVSLGGEYEYRLSESQTSWGLNVLGFENESDASVGYYNSKIYGHNNRRGWSVSLSGHFRRSKLKAELGLVQSAVLEDNALYQDDQNLIFFKLGKEL